MQVAKKCELHDFIMSLPEGKHNLQSVELSVYIDVPVQVTTQKWELMARNFLGANDND